MPEPTENQQKQDVSQREPAILLPGAVLVLLGLMVAVFVASQLILNDEGKASLTFWFGFIPFRLFYPAGIDGGWLPLLWTPVTYAFLHAGWDHLLLNCAWLAVFGTPVARRYGATAVWLVFLVGAVTGAVLFAIIPMTPQAFLVGASGGIAALTGAACRFMFQPVVVARDPETGEERALGRRTASLKDLVKSGNARFFIAMWIILNAAVPLFPDLLGGSGGISWQAHLGGFIFGLLIVPLLDRQADRRARQ